MSSKLWSMAPIIIFLTVTQSSRVYCRTLSEETQRLSWWLPCLQLTIIMMKHYLLWDMLIGQSPSRTSLESTKTPRTPSCVNTNLRSHSLEKCLPRWRGKVRLLKRWVPPSPSFKVKSIRTKRLLKSTLKKMLTLSWLEWRLRVKESRLWQSRKKKLNRLKRIKCKPKWLNSWRCRKTVNCLTKITWAYRMLSPTKNNYLP
jgi:hypothetical protein